MINLLKTDLKRIIKDKLFLIVCIIGAAFAIITPLLYFLIFKVAGDLSDIEMMGLNFSGKSVFFSSFSPASDFGIILPIFISIIIFKDFSYGTIRNKIISGHSRVSIFASMFISSFITLFSIIILYAFLSLGVTLLFVNYQAEPFGIKDLGYFLASLGFVLLGYLFIAAIISFLSVSMKNVGLTIVSYAAISMVFTIVSSLLQIGILILESNGNSTVLPILEFFQNINLFNSLGTVIGQGHTYTLENILYLVLSSVIGIVFYGGFGLLIINKKEIK